MRVIEDIKFLPLKGEDGEVTGYLSKVRVEVSGQIFEASRVMTAAEYKDTYPMLREFIHGNILRNEIMVGIRKKLFEGVAA